MANETFSSFDIVQTTTFLQIREIVPWEIEWVPVEPSNFLDVVFTECEQNIVTA